MSAWRSAFLRMPYLRDSLARMGAVIETSETAATCDTIPALINDVRTQVGAAALKATGHPATINCRPTHVYPDGAAPYFTVAVAGRPGDEVEIWDDIKAATNDVLHRHRATITHAPRSPRRIAMASLAEARRLSGPVFVKPSSDKSFPAAVYASGSCLPTGPELPQQTPVQVSFRLYLLDGEVRTGSQYATFGRLDAERLDGHRYEGPVREFVDDLPAACGSGLAWFSNCNAADPDRALGVVLRSAGPRTQMAERDCRFCRRGRDTQLAG